MKNNILYVSDNIGFLYSCDYQKNIVVWAKKYDVAFRSNIKILDKKIVASNQNNKLIFLTKKIMEKSLNLYLLKKQKKIIY